jgi:predicted SprT family Zn-dependent metalloprotease
MPDPYWTDVGKQVEKAQAAEMQRQVNFSTMRKTFRCACGRQAAKQRRGRPVCDGCKKKPSCVSSRDTRWL